MTKVKLLEDREWMDGSRRCAAAEGDVCEIYDPAVLKTFLDIGAARLATAADEAEVETEDEAAGPSGGEPTASAGDAPSKDAPTEVATWDDVDGISDRSLSLLKKNAPDADPLTIETEALKKALDGSEQMARLVGEAINTFRRGGSSK